MKKAIGLLALVLCLHACTTNDTKPAATAPASENDVDAARNFIRAALDGKWSEARQFMLQDSVNTQLLDMAEKHYEKSDRETRRGYREASIQFFDTQQSGDSMTIISYANSFMNQKSALKLLHVGDQWLVDLKYSFLSTDTIKHVH